MNPDLPQFGDDGEGWKELNLAFDLGGYCWGMPVALQIITPKGRQLVTGIITSTEDVFPPNVLNNDTPIRSVIYFRDADDVSIEWAEVHAVLAMVATIDDQDAGEGPLMND